MPNIENARILIIGGAGFVGSHIVDQLLAEPVSQIVVLDNFVRGTRANLAGAAEDDRVHIVEGSVADLELLRFADAGSRLRLPARGALVARVRARARSAIDVNVVGTWNVVETAHETGVKHVVYSSSASVYGNALETPMTEERPFNNRTLYGAAKIAGEQFFPDYKGTYVSVIMKVLDRRDVVSRYVPHDVADQVKQASPAGRELVPRREHQLRQRRDPGRRRADVPVPSRAT